MEFVKQVFGNIPWKKTEKLVKNIKLKYREFKIIYNLNKTQVAWV